MKPILMIAYHYPPEGSSSGVLRTLKFSKYLPHHGWHPHVLTLRESIYPVRDEGLARDVPAETLIHRTLAFDASRHFAVRGRHPAWLEVPDRFVSWLPFGIVRGLRVIREAGIRALYSTSPQPTAHLIAAALHAVTGIPWVADFRDPWIEEGIHPAPGSVRYRVESILEAFVVRHASRVTVTTEPFRREMLDRYPDLDPDRVITLFNGYDEADFAEIPPLDRASRFEILHTGLVTRDYRDPFPLLHAVKRTVDQSRIDRRHIRVTFLGGGTDVASRAFRDAVGDLGVGDLVDIVDRLPYSATLQRMTRAAVLLLLQASDDTRTLIPAKAFEYMRVGRPVLALTFEGATAALIRDCGAGVVADPRQAGAVEAGLMMLYDRWRRGTPPQRALPAVTRRFERAAITAELASILDRITRGHTTGETAHRAPSVASV